MSDPIFILMDYIIYFLDKIEKIYGKEKKEVNIELRNLYTIWEDEEEFVLIGDY